MKNFRLLRSFAFAGLIALLVALPSAQVQSQTAVSQDVFDALVQLAARNQEILQKQEESIRSLDDILNEARQAKAFSKRG